MDEQFIQTLIDKAVKAATRYTLDGRPVSRIQWIPSKVASQNPHGLFVVILAGNLKASDDSPWD